MDENLPGQPTPDEDRNGQEPPKRYFEEQDRFEANPPHGECVPGKPSTGLMALSIVTIAFAGLLLLFNCCGVGGMALLPAMKNMPGMQGQPGTEIYSDGAFIAISIAFLVANLCMYSFALAGGIGALRLREWGRKVSLGYASASLLLFVVQNMVNFFVMEEKTQAALQGNPLASMFQDNPLFRILSVAFNFTCLNTLPIFILVVLTRSSVKRQFEAAERLRQGGQVG